jgi:DNA invertase Pin-like site-specific DNA recombinase
VSAEAAVKVTASHLARTAYLYVRQSTLKQVLNNTESTARQYALRQRAAALGWPAAQIITIDTDQGHSGASAADREGFQHLVAEVGMGRAGIVLGLEVSRLARNNADWHRLLEICALSSTLICDEDGLYDPGEFNDRLLLGLKGTMSEAELHFIRARLRGGQLSAARRGELRMGLPVGLVYDGAGHIVLDPDTGVQDAIRHPVRGVRPHRLGPRRGRRLRRRAAAVPGADPHRAPQGRAGLDAADPLAGAAHPAQPPLCRGVRLWPPPRSPRGQRQEDLPGAAARAVDRADPRRPPRIHHLGHLRGQPAATAGQRRRPRHRPGRRPGPRRHRPAAGPGRLRPLRAADDRPLPHPRRHRSPRLPVRA